MKVKDVVILKEVAESDGAITCFFKVTTTEWEALFPIISIQYEPSRRGRRHFPGEGKEAMLAVMDRYLGMPDEERLLFRLGRRGGALRSLDDLNDPLMRQRLQSAMRDLSSQTDGDVEKLITELADQYI